MSRHPFNTTTSRAEQDQRDGEAIPSHLKHRSRFGALIMPGQAFSDVRAILRLGAPTIIVLLVQIVVSVAETYYLSFLGTDALAGAALVLPVMSLMATMANGGIGGGVASAVARARGAGRLGNAESIAAHAVMLGLALGLGFAALLWALGPFIYSGLGGTGKALKAALLYSNVLFVGAPLMWITNLLSASLRGAHDAKTPALITLTGAVIVVILSPLFIFGAGPFKGFGIAGAGIAVNLYYFGASVFVVRHMRRPYAALKLGTFRFRLESISEILKVGILSAVGTLQLSFTTLLLTSAVGVFGTQALAGYGVASRLDFLVIPLVFGIGSAVTVLVGNQIGVGDGGAAKRIAWSGALLAVVASELVGGLAATMPTAWMSLFSTDSSVIAIGASYLRGVAPFYGFVGLGLALYFASQGAGNVVWPFLAGTARFAIAGVAGLVLVAKAGKPIEALFVMAAAGMIANGLITALATATVPWKGHRASVKGINVSTAEP